MRLRADRADAQDTPADKKLYALRDVTATVESPFLICASIMSKKMAEGIDALVLDVKTGSGAFMKNSADAEYLAGLMVETGKRMGKKMVALITDMDQPLGRKVGNALEVEEVLEILNGQGPVDLRELCDELSAWMFLLGGRVKTVAEGKQLAAEMIASGRARDTFSRGHPPARAATRAWWTSPAAFLARGPSSTSPRIAGATSRQFSASRLAWPA